MQIAKLVAGLHAFRSEYFPRKRKLFEHLAQGQSPEVLFITCADSRINPNLLTQSQPGELFILRNAGNLVPPHGAPGGGEAATIEYAVAALGVKDIIICGHSQCGAMNGLVHPEKLEALPVMKQWLSHAEATRRIVAENYQCELTEEERVAVCTEENVLVQLENLRTHPAVAAKLARGELRLHGWVYSIRSGEVHAYDPELEQFTPLLPEEVPSEALEALGLAPSGTPGAERRSA
jgi:carbonic anhydrase